MTDTTNGIHFMVTDPDIIDLVRKVRQGTTPLKDLHIKLGRRKVDRALNKCEMLALRIKLYLRDYLKDPIGTDIKFLKKHFGINGSGSKTHFQLDEKIGVRELSEDTLILIIGGDSP